MIEKGDKIVQMRLLNPHEADHLYKKENGTFYWQHHRKNGDTFSIPEIQMEMFPPPPPKKIEIPKEKRRIDVLKKHYGEDWKPVQQEGLEDHY